MQQQQPDSMVVGGDVSTSIQSKRNLLIESMLGSRDTSKNNDSNRIISARTHPVHIHCQELEMVGGLPG
jgi:hypothetical protein